LAYYLDKTFRASKPKDLDRIAKRGCGHLLLKEENLSFDNDYIMFLLQVYPSIVYIAYYYTSIFVPV
jgi:hypothetical protein